MIPPTMCSRPTWSSLKPRALWPSGSPILKWASLGLETSPTPLQGPQAPSSTCVWTSRNCRSFLPHGLDPAWPSVTSIPSGPLSHLLHLICLKAFFSASLLPCPLSLPWLPAGLETVSGHNVTRQPPFWGPTLTPTCNPLEPALIRGHAALGKSTG